MVETTCVNVFSISPNIAQYCEESPNTTACLLELVLAWCSGVTLELVTIIAQLSAAAALTTRRWTRRISYSLTQLQNGNLDDIDASYLTSIPNRST